MDSWIILERQDHEVLGGFRVIQWYSNTWS